MESIAHEKKSVNPRIAWPNEAKHFTPWLSENLHLLNGVLGLALSSPLKEHAAGRYRADIVATQGTERVLIEAQLATSDHSHLGQCITYAACLDISTVIWVATDFTDEHITALEQINRHHFLNCYAVVFAFEQVGTFFTPTFHTVCLPAADIWTKEGSLVRMHMNAYLQQAIYYEPKLQPFLDEAMSQENIVGYDRVKTYYALKNKCWHLVGHKAANPALRTKEHFDAVIQTIDDLLPADDSEYYDDYSEMPLERRLAWQEWERTAVL